MRPTKTKGFRFDSRLIEAFEAHCAQNMLDQRALVESLLLYGIQATPADLRRLQQATEAWLSER